MVSRKKEEKTLFYLEECPKMLGFIIAADDSL